MVLLVGISSTILHAKLKSFLLFYFFSFILLLLYYMMVKSSVVWSCMEGIPTCKHDTWPHISMLAKG